MKKALLLLSFILVSLTGFAQESGLTDEIKNHIKARVDSQTDVAISVGFINGDKVEFYNAGKTAMKNGMDVDKNSVFEIGSISKTFTGILLAQKVLAGDMSLDDPISKYLPKTVKVPSRNGKQITIRDLATHASALPRMPDNFSPADPTNPFVDYTYENLYSFLSNHELTRDIGVKSEYSNLGMGLLGHILELQSGKTYEQLVIENIAKPLGMNDTSITLSEAMKKRLAKGHDGLTEVSNWDIISMAGAGGIRSTANDMVKFLQANMGITKTPLMEAMQLSHQPAFKNEADDFEIGLAWHYEDDKAVIWHNGRTGGYSAFAGFLPKENTGVVVLTNSTADIGALSFKSLGGPMELVAPKKSMISLMKNEISKNGISSAIALYKTMKNSGSKEYRIDENVLNTIGYEFLSNKNLEDALTLFKLNVELYPEASNPYDSLGEALLENGNEAEAILNYKKSLELNPANDNARDVLKRLGVALKEVTVSKEMLESYVGSYQLAPTFSIAVSTKDGRLFAQATGQPQFELFPSDYNKFYLKVVEARVEFNANNKGKIDSMTLFQNGQVMPGKRVD